MLHIGEHMASKHQPSSAKVSDPSKIPAFDRAMRGLILVPKSEMPATKSKPAKKKK
jgi:hypothetical protein